MMQQHDNLAAKGRAIAHSGVAQARVHHAGKSSKFAVISGSRNEARNCHAEVLRSIWPDLPHRPDPSDYLRMTIEARLFTLPQKGRRRSAWDRRFLCPAAFRQVQRI